jgi:hypothetical protein
MAFHAPGARVSLLTTREVLSADGSITQVGVPVAIADDDDGLDPTWPTLPVEERFRQIFTLLELSMDFRDLSRQSMSSRRVDRTVNVLDFRQDVQH